MNSANIRYLGFTQGYLGLFPITQEHLMEPTHDKAFTTPDDMMRVRHPPAAGDEADDA